MTPPVQILYAVPVGAVIAWYPPMSPVVLPPGFVACDGGTVHDAESAFDGRAVPDLRMRFVLGADAGIAPGAAGGSPAANLTGFETGQWLTSPTQAQAADSAANAFIERDNPVSSGWRYDLSASDSGWNDGNHHHSLPAPGSVALLYIIRIK